MTTHYSREMINRKATGAIAAFRIIAGTATDGVVEQADGPRAKLVGASGQIAAGDGERVDVCYSGIVPIEFGAAIAFGDRLTSDANGKAVPANDGDHVVGVAQENGVAGVIGTVQLALGAGTELGVAAAPAFVANDLALTAAHCVHGRVLTIPQTAGVSTVTLPADAPDGTRLQFVADGNLNDHTVQYRDATGPTALTAALTANKRHLVTAIKVAGAWYADSGVSP